VTPQVEWRGKTVTTEKTEWHMSLDHLYLCPLTSTDIPAVTGSCPNHCPFNNED